MGNEKKYMYSNFGAKILYCETSYEEGKITGTVFINGKNESRYKMASFLLPLA